MLYKKIIKHGHCYAIIIPIEWVRELELSRGDYVALGLAEGGLLVIKKAEKSMQAFLQSKPITND